uniref:Hint domain-containing protein n=1 Tax=Pyrodinium bahamense TaxID=73915 RepID=A0A7S0AA91_9DINO
MVWIEGEPLPVAVASVRAGQRVLCYDRLGRGVRYSDILAVEVAASGAAQWVEVLLEDGTRLEMTADHPVHLAQQNHHGHFVACANELRPGTDGLFVLKVAPMAVKSVVPAESASPTRVALCVGQPDRHAILAAAPRRNGCDSMPQIQALAVGSSDTPHSWNRLVTRRTSLECGSEVSTSPRGGGSAPASLHGDANRLLNGDQMGLGRMSLSSSSDSSQKLKGSSEDDARVMVCTECKPEPACGDRCLGSRPAVRGEPMALSSVLQVRAAGLSSLGAARHAEGRCMPCVFQNHFQHGVRDKPCKEGIMCKRCHADHRKLQRVKDKTGWR